MEEHRQEIYFLLPQGRIFITFCLTIRKDKEGHSSSYKRASEGHARCQMDVLHLHKGEWMSSIYNCVCRASYQQYDASCFFQTRVATLLAHPSISHFDTSVEQAQGCMGRNSEEFDKTSELRRASPTGLTIWEGVSW